MRELVRSRVQAQACVQARAITRSSACAWSFQARKRERVRARKKKWRRPWDGEDGADFGEWSKQRDLLEEQAEDAGEEFQDKPEEDGKENGNFNWKGCELEDF